MYVPALMQRVVHKTRTCFGSVDSGMLVDKTVTSVVVLSCALTDFDITVSTGDLEMPTINTGQHRVVAYGLK